MIVNVAASTITKDKEGTRVYVMGPHPPGVVTLKAEKV